MTKIKPPMMLAREYTADGKHSWPLWCEPKLDGYRFMIIYSGEDRGRVVQRSGVDYTSKLGFLAEQLADGFNAIFPQGCMVDGEVFHQDWGSTTSLVKTDGAMDRSALVFYAFDLVDPNLPALPLRQRKADLESILQAAGDMAPNWSLTHHVPVSSHAEVQTLFAKFLEHGFEGAMLKDPEARYRKNRQKAWLKFKPWKSTEGRVTAFQKGTGRLTNTLGALGLTMPDGSTVYVGSGFTDAQRDEIWGAKDTHRDRLVEFKHQDDPSAVASYRFPIFLRFRADME